MENTTEAKKRRINGFLHYRWGLGEGMQSAVYFDLCQQKCKRMCAGHFIKEHPVGIDEPEKEWYTADELIEYLLNEQKFCASAKLSILFTGGEPLKDVWYCVHVARAVKEHGMGVLFRTCGNLSPDNYYIVSSYTDLFIFDLFTMIPSDHKKITGFYLDRSLDALYYLDRNRFPYRLRIRILPGISEKEPIPFAAFCKTLKNVKSVILDFNDSGLSQDKIRAYRDCFLEQGITLY